MRCDVGEVIIIIIIMLYSKFKFLRGYLGDLVGEVTEGLENEL